MTGQFPKLDVDHIDRNKSNNAWNNLREVTKSENMRNVEYPLGVSGIKHVTRTKNGKKWKVQMSVDGKHRTFGEFDSLKEAKEVAITRYKQIIGD